MWQHVGFIKKKLQNNLYKYVHKTKAIVLKIKERYNDNVATKTKKRDKNYKKHKWSQTVIWFHTKNQRTLVNYTKI